MIFLIQAKDATIFTISSIWPSTIRLKNLILNFLSKNIFQLWTMFLLTKSFWEKELTKEFEGRLFSISRITQDSNLKRLLMKRLLLIYDYWQILKLSTNQSLLNLGWPKTSIFYKWTLVMTSFNSTLHNLALVRLFKRTRLWPSLIVMLFILKWQILLTRQVFGLTKPLLMRNFTGLTKLILLTQMAKFYRIVWLMSIQSHLAISLK